MVTLYFAEPYSPATYNRIIFNATWSSSDDIDCRGSLSRSEDLWHLIITIPKHHLLYIITCRTSHIYSIMSSYYWIIKIYLSHSNWSSIWKMCCIHSSYLSKAVTSLVQCSTPHPRHSNRVYVINVFNVGCGNATVFAVCFNCLLCLPCFYVSL